MRRPLPIAALSALLLSLVLAGCTRGPSEPPSDDGAPTPTPSPTATPVDGALGPDFFGMHDSDPRGESWPQAPVGSLRIWDSGVVWSQVETAPGQYDWSTLDATVKAARDHHASALIVLGQTPAFHSRHPKRVGAYGPGAASMPDLAAWTAYVRAVVERYNAPDVAFQVWNEANVEGYWNGSYRQMARLTAAARAVVDSVTPKPVLVAPAMATRTLGQRAGLRLLYAESVKGVRMADLVDVVSLQLYPEDGEGLVRKDALLTEARRILGLQGVPADKPVWDTEINFGLQGGDPATPASPEDQMTNVAMSYLLDAAGQVQRVYWYAWDLHTIANTTLVADDNTALTRAGQAFVTVHRWLLGSRVDGCRPVQDVDVWSCALTTPHGPATVFWSPSGSATVRTGFGATSAEVLGSAATELPLGGTTLEVGKLPVLVLSDRAGVPALPPRV
jgi:hypothetical protein